MISFRPLTRRLVSALARRRTPTAFGWRAESRSNSFEEWAAKDPVELFERRLVEAGVLDAESASAIRERARQQAIDARRKALADPMPDPTTVEVGVYAD